MLYEVITPLLVLRELAAKGVEGLAEAIERRCLEQGSQALKRCEQTCVVSSERLQVVPLLRVEPVKRGEEHVLLELEVRADRVPVAHEGVARLLPLPGRDGRGKAGVDLVELAVLLADP